MQNNSPLKSEFYLFSAPANWSKIVTADQSENKRIWRQSIFFTYNQRKNPIPHPRAEIFDQSPWITSIFPSSPLQTNDRCIKLI